MANKRHLQILFESIASGDCRIWNNWRIDHPKLFPELMGLELWEPNLPFVNLSRSDLRLANLRRANLYHTNLGDSDLSLAILENANLREANMSGSKLYRTNLSNADLGSANLRGADLRGANLTGARLKDANLADIIIDAAALKRLQDPYVEGVSRLERIALQLTKHRKAKRIHPAVVKATPNYLEDN